MMEGRVRTCKPKIAIPMLIIDVHFYSIVFVVVVIVVTLSGAPFPLGALALFPCLVAYGVTSRCYVALKKNGLLATKIPKSV